MTMFLVTAWCDRPYYARCEIEAESPEEALEIARMAIHDAPAEECDHGYPWDEWRVDTAEAEGVLLQSDRPDLLSALQAAEGVIQWAIDHGAQSKPVLTMVREAIAKATGGAA